MSLKQSNGDIRRMTKPPQHAGQKKQHEEETDRAIHLLALDIKHLDNSSIEIKNDQKFISIPVVRTMTGPTSSQNYKTA